MGCSNTVLRKTKSLVKVGHPFNQRKNVITQLRSVWVQWSYHADLFKMTVFCHTYFFPIPYKRRCRSQLWFTLQTNSRHLCLRPHTWVCLLIWWGPSLVSSVSSLLPSCVCYPFYYPLPCRKHSLPIAVMFCLPHFVGVKEVKTALAYACVYSEGTILYWTANLLTTWCSRLGCWGLQ